MGQTKNANPVQRRTKPDKYLLSFFCLRQSNFYLKADTGKKFKQFLTKFVLIIVLQSDLSVACPFQRHTFLLMLFSCIMFSSLLLMVSSIVFIFVLYSPWYFSNLSNAFAALLQCIGNIIIPFNHPVSVNFSNLPFCEG